MAADAFVQPIFHFKLVSGLWLSLCLSYVTMATRLHRNWVYNFISSFLLFFFIFNTIFRVFPFQLNIKSPFIDFNFFNAPRTRCCVQFEHGDVKRMLRTKFLFKFILYLTWLTILSRYPLFVFLVFLCWLRFLLCERVCVMPVSAISRNS